MTSLLERGRKGEKVRCDGGRTYFGKRSEEVGRGRKRSEEVGKQEAVIHNREKRDGFLPKKFSADLYA
jgi:hypothetical protein